MTCLIVDDNPMARLALRNMLSNIAEISSSQECESALEAFNILQKNATDLLFLDVEMPGMSGLELLQNLEEPPLVILITSKTEYAVEGFNLEVLDYIVKPVSMPRLLKAVQRAKNRLTELSPADSPEFSNDHLFVRIENQLHRISFDDILFVHALGDYIVFQTATKKYPVHLTMKSIEEKLPDQRFMRVHRSYIVAIKQIENLEQNSLKIGQFIVPVSETKKKPLMDKLNII